MRFFTVLAFTALAMGSSDLPWSRFRWQRSILPPASAPSQAACVVLDPAIFSHADPGLRDLRLYQDGQEIPFAVEESLDRRALETGSSLPDDRSLFETSIEPRGVTPMPSAGGVSGAAPDQLRPFIAHFDLPSYIPVERLRLLPAPTSRVVVSVSAADVAAPQHTEYIHGELDAGHPVLPLTIGANLQHRAYVDVQLLGATADTRVAFEMRRRSLCYQPRSASLLTLFLGSPGMAAPQYDYARRFSPETSRPLASLGALQTNPAFTPPQAHGLLHSRANQWRVALLLSAGYFLFSANRLLHAKRSVTHEVRNSPAQR